MNKKLIIYCTTSLIIGFIIYILKRLKHKLPNIINNYLNDFLIIPIVLFICLMILRKTRNDKNIYINLPVILYLCTLYSLLFEFIFPEYLARYTKDYIDVILYFASGIIFYKLQKTRVDQSNKNTKSNIYKNL